MSDGNGANLGKIPHKVLIDELVLTMDRGDGTMKIGGKCISNEVALEMCARGVRYFETLMRIDAVQQVKQQQTENARVQEMLNRARQRSG
jgi:hypothetical protein